MININVNSSALKRIISRRVHARKRYVKHPRPLKTHCKYGHKLSSDNIVGKERRCKICVTRTGRDTGRRSRGWTNELVEVRKTEQNNCCAICGDRFIAEPHADHEHTDPPKPRGLLCADCNIALGGFKDNPDILIRAANYLTKWRKN